MLEGIKEKMLELLYDIEEEVSKESKLYAHAYDIYADIDVIEIDERIIMPKISKVELDELIDAMGRKGFVTIDGIDYKPPKGK